MNDIALARAKWIRASDAASSLAKSMHQSGSGYGDPDAQIQDEHRLQTARHEAERLFREYDDLSRQETDLKLMALQNSQRRATWASVAVAVVAGVAAIASVVVAVLAYLKPGS